MASIDTVNSPVTCRLSLRPQERSGFGLFDLAPVIMSALAADVMGPLGLPTVRAFIVGRGRKRVMGPALVAPGRGRLSLGDRHGGTTPYSPLSIGFEGARRRAGQSDGAGKNEARSEPETPSRFKRHFLTPA